MYTYVFIMTTYIYVVMYIDLSIHTYISIYVYIHVQIYTQTANLIFQIGFLPHAQMDVDIPPVASLFRAPTGRVRAWLEADRRAGEASLGGSNDRTIRGSCGLGGNTLRYD